MSDTIRTRAQILLALADNTSGDITPQIIRDLLVSVLGVYGTIKAVANTTIQTMATATSAKVEHFTKDGLAVGETPDYATNKITLDNSGTYIVFSQASFKSSVADVALVARLAIDDTAIDGRFDMEMVNADEAASGFCIDIIAVNAAEVLSLRVETDKITNLTLIDAQLGAVRIG